MSEADDIDLLAGEYVLGTLDLAERTAAAERALRDPLFASAIAEWEAQLAPLDTETPEVVPSPAAWNGILARLDAAAGQARSGLASSSSAPVSSAVMIHLTRRLKRWRAAALVSGSIAAAITLGFIWRETNDRQSGQNFVAVLQRDAESPAFIVEVDLRNRSMSVRPVAAPPQPGKSYELWLIHDSLKAPESLGTVADKGFTVKAALANYNRTAIEDGTYAVTLEPAGGSPNGKPSGAPLWTGKLVQATP